MYSILVIDDDESIRKMLEAFFEGEGLSVTLAANGSEGWRKFLQTSPLVVIVDQLLPDARGIEILGKIKKHIPDTQVIIITGYGEIKDAVKAMELGALNYLVKPIDLQELKILVQQALKFASITKERDHYREQIEVHVRGRVAPILFKSNVMKNIFEQCKQVAQSNATVLLEGESGTGKGLLAHYIHQISERAHAPFIDIDCASIPETLIESELFGYEPGAFTDAKKKKEGLVELAHSGSLFLDEVGAMPLPLQSKLLKVIEEKSFRKLGGGKEINVDVRVILATNADLKEMVNQNKFREDLYFRISTFPISLPPLRKRKEDIPSISRHFCQEISKELHKDVLEIEDEAIKALIDYHWPGNIRELRNTIEKAVIVAKGKMITVNDLHLEAAQPSLTKDYKRLSYKEAKRQFEIEIIENALAQSRGNQSEAADNLGISRDLLIRRMRKYNINPKKYKAL